MKSIQEIISTKTDNFLQTYIGDIQNEASVPSYRLSTEAKLSSTPDISYIEPDPASIDKLTGIIQSMKIQLDSMLLVLVGCKSLPSECDTSDMLVSNNKSKISNLKSKIHTIEGVFNGEKMVGADGREYHVPPNYASKSKLVEGDMMKLTITEQGRFIYKQIGPIDRQRVVGALSEDTSKGCWQVIYNNRAYRILTASVTFYRGAAGDNVVILVPKDGESLWGAVENIIHLSA